MSEPLVKRANQVLLVSTSYDGFHVTGMGTRPLSVSFAQTSVTRDNVNFFCNGNSCKSFYRQSFYRYLIG